MSDYTMQFETEDRGTRVVMFHNLPEENGQVIEFPFDAVPSVAKDIAHKVCEIALASLNSDNARGIKWQAGYIVDNRFTKPAVPYDVPLMIRWPEQDDGSKWISLSWVYGPDDNAITVARDEACLILNLWIDQLK